MAETPTTKVAVKAKMKIDSQPADIIASFGDGFTLFLTQRAKLGTPISFCQWAKRSFKADIPLLDFEFPENKAEQKEAVEKQLKKMGVPDFLQPNLARLLLVDIWLDDLVVDTKLDAFKLGMTLDFTGGDGGWELLPNCELEEFQLLITRATEGYKFPERPDVRLLEEPAEIDDDTDDDDNPPPQQQRKRAAKKAN
jgi:hypothetical protein